MDVQRQPVPAVVVVDDDPAMIIVLCRLAASLAIEHDIITTPDGNAALAHLATRQVPLVITDDQISGMNGLQLTSAIKARAPGVRVLLLTAYHTPVFEQQAQAEQVDYYLPKPFAFERFEQIVRAALAPL